MNQNNALVGSAAIDMLVGQLHRNEIGLPDSPKASFTQSTWIDATTTGGVSSFEPIRETTLV